MSLTTLPIFSLLGERMKWLGQRQTVLAENVANADTPGFKARDLKPMDFAAVVRRMAHGQAAGGSQTGAQIDRQRDTYETTLSGNDVVLEEQMIKVAQTTAEYQLATTLYSKHVGLIRTALNGRR